MPPTDAEPRHAPPRIAPGTRAEIGVVNMAIARVLGVVAGTGPPNLFTTLARHRRLYRPWLRFAARLMPGGTLPAADTELVILRVAHRRGCAYEWRHHQQLAARAGLDAEKIDRVREGAEAGGWTPRQALLLAAVDELLDRTSLSDEVWRRLEEELSERQRIELPMLVGHYAMLAMTLNALRVQPDPLPRAPRTALGRLAARLGELRR